MILIGIIYWLLSAVYKVVPESLVYDLEIPEDFDPSIYCE
jgi:hypothetical protein